jgi:hypothetical protein
MEAGFQLEADELMAKRRRLLAKVGIFNQLEHWIDRTGGIASETPAMHYPYADIVVSSGDPEKDAQFMDDALLASYAGGSPPHGTHISDSESRAREAEAQRPPEMAEEELDKLNTPPPPTRSNEQRRDTYRTDQQGRVMQ